MNGYPDHHQDYSLGNLFWTRYPGNISNDFIIFKDKYEQLYDFFCDY